MTLDLFVVPGDDLTRTQTDQIIELCSEVFRCDYAFYMNLGLDRVHVLGYMDGRLISHALWLFRRLRIGSGPWFEAAYVEGVATNAGFRRQGYGSAVMRRLQQEISSFDLGVLSPAQVGWYERLGWERWQGPLLILKDEELQPTPDECALVCRTPRTAELDLSASLTAEWRPFALW